MSASTFLEHLAWADDLARAMAAAPDETAALAIGLRALAEQLGATTAAAYLVDTTTGLATRGATVEREPGECQWLPVTLPPEVLASCGDEGIAAVAIDARRIVQPGPAGENAAQPALLVRTGRSRTASGALLVLGSGDWPTDHEVIAGLCSMAVRHALELRERDTFRASAEERYRLLFERNVAAVFRTSRDGRVLACNEPFATLFGYRSPEELRDVAITTFYVRPRDREALLGILDKDGHASATELDLVTRQGNPLRARGSVSLVQLLPEGETVLEGSLVDITTLVRDRERKAADLRLEALGRLAGGIAHDFNNVLMAISGATEALTRDRESAAQVAGTIHHAVKRGAAMTQKLLAFAKHAPAERSPTKLDALLEQEMAIIGRLLPENISLTLALGAPDGVVMIDHGQLSQVMLNLCVNARDVMASGGTLTISSREVVHEAGGAGELAGLPPGRYVAVAVQDTGPGIPADVLQQIFDPFFTTKPRGRGTGLGLSVVRGLVTQLGGTVTVETRQGLGTTFTVVLPLADDAAATLDEGGPDQAITDRVVVLLADDDDSVRGALAAMLRGEDVHLMEARDGLEALAIIEAASPAVDVVVTDVMMPRLDGLELFDLFVNADESRGTPGFVFCSGYAEPALPTAFSEGQPVAFLQKPFRAKELIAAIERVRHARPHS